MGLSAPVYVPKRLDTQEKIQAELNRLGSAGGEVELAPTTVEMTQAGTVTTDALTQGYGLHIPASHGPLRIFGALGAVLKLADGAAANTIPLLVRGTNATPRTARTSLEGFTVDGNRANVTAWTDVSWGLITAEYAQNLEVVGCRVMAPPGHCINFQRLSMNGRIAGCLIDELGHQSAGAIRVESADMRVTDNVVIGHDAFTGTRPLIHVAMNGDTGTGAEMVLVANNVLRMNNAASGILLENASRNVLQGNTIRDANLGGSSGIAISLKLQVGGAYTQPNAYNVIDSNQIYSVRNGIQLDGTTSVTTVSNMVSNNVIVDGPTTGLDNGIYETGTASYVDWNIAKNNRVITSVTPFTALGANSDIAAASNYTS